MLPLDLLGEGERGEIVAHRRPDGATGVDGRAQDMGLQAGKRVVVLKNGTGPLLVKVEEARLALDRGLAMRIRVRKDAG